MITYPRLTVGVEEEFLILDQDTLFPAPAISAVQRELPENLCKYFRNEFHASQIEMVTGVCSTREDLYEELIRNRQAAVAAANRTGYKLASAGMPIFHDKSEVTPGIDRYRVMSDRYGAVSGEPDVFGHHVHVGMLTANQAVKVATRMRIYLPIIQSMMTNSPFFQGKDTGYASWRHLNMYRIPIVGPFPHCHSIREYDKIVAGLIRAGIAVSDRNFYWWVRPSVKFPTIEIRIGDVSLNAHDSTLISIIIRALVAFLLSEVEHGAITPVIPDAFVREAHWRSAKDGLEGNAVDLSTMEYYPAWELVDKLINKLLPVLEEYDDLDFVLNGLDKLRAEGSGAARQRKVFEAEGIPGLMSFITSQVDHS